VLSRQQLCHLYIALVLRDEGIVARFSAYVLDIGSSVVCGTIEITAGLLRNHHKLRSAEHSFHENNCKWPSYCRTCAYAPIRPVDSRLCEDKPLAFLTSCRSPFKASLIEKNLTGPQDQVLRNRLGLRFRVAESHYQEANACAEGYWPENKQQVHQVRDRNDDCPVQVRKLHGNLEDRNADKPS